MDRTEQTNLEGNINKICLINFLDGMWFPGSVFVIFLLDSGMNLAQVGLILAGSSIMPFFFDIPSSLWADKYSRKSMLALSWIAYLSMNAIYSFSNSFAMFFIAFCLNGLGTALSMGIFSAFVYDTLLSLKKEKQYEKTQSRIKKYFYAGRLSASIIGAYVYLINPRMVFFMSTVASIICLALVYLLKEPHREKSIRKPLHQIMEGLDFLLGHKITWYSIVIFSLMAGISELLFNYFQPVMSLTEIPVVYFGIIYFLSSAFSILGLIAYPKIRKYIHWKKIIFLYLIIALITSLSFTTSSQFLIIAAIIVFSFFSSPQDVFISNVINRIVPSTHRATSLSIQSQIHLIFNTILIVIISGVANRFSIGIGMILVSALVIIISALFLKLIYNEHKTINGVRHGNRHWE